LGLSGEVIGCDHVVGEEVDRDGGVGSGVGDVERDITGSPSGWDTAILTCKSSNQGGLGSKSLSEPADKTLDMSGCVGVSIELNIDSGESPSVVKGSESSGVGSIHLPLVDSPESASVVSAGHESSNEDGISRIIWFVQRSATPSFTR
jgi:hypothetical protein